MTMIREKGSKVYGASEYTNETQEQVHRDPYFLDVAVSYNPSSEELATAVKQLASRPGCQDCVVAGRLVAALTEDNFFNLPPAMIRMAWRADTGEEPIIPATHTVSDYQARDFARHIVRQWTTSPIGLGDVIHAVGKNPVWSRWQDSAHAYLVGVNQLTGDFVLFKHA